MRKMPDTNEPLETAFYKELLLHPRELGKRLVRAFQKVIQDGEITQSCSMLQNLNQAIEETDHKQNILFKVFRALLASQRIPAATEALLPFVDILANISKAALLDKEELEIFVPDMIQSVVAEKEMEFSLRLEAVRWVNLYLRGFKFKSDDEDASAVCRAFSEIKGDSRHLLATAGDYELQNGILEMIFRLTPAQERKSFATASFTANSEVQMFVDINEGEFEAGCRHFLNTLNGNQSTSNRSVHSFPCKNAFFGKSQVQQPKYQGLKEFWVDFNLGSKSITCFVLDESEAVEKESQWETVIIPAKSVLAYRFKETDEEVFILLKLDKPVSEIIDFLPENQEHYVKLCFEKSHIPSAVTEQILGPIKKKSGVSKSDGEAGSTLTKASVAINSIHLSSRASGVTKVVPTANVELPPLPITPEVSEEDSSETLSQEFSGTKDISQKKSCIEEDTAVNHEDGGGEEEVADFKETDGVQGVQGKSDECGEDENGTPDDKNETEVHQENARILPIVVTGLLPSATRASVVWNDQAQLRRSIRLSSRTESRRETKTTGQCGDGANTFRERSPHGTNRNVTPKVTDAAVADGSAEGVKSALAPSNSCAKSAGRVERDHLSSSDEGKEDQCAGDESGRNEESADEHGKACQTAKRAKSPLHFITKGPRKDSSSTSEEEETQRKYPSAFNVGQRLEAARRRRSSSDVSDSERQARKALKEKVFSHGPSPTSPVRVTENPKKKTDGKFDSLSLAPKARSSPKRGKKRALTPSKPLPPRGKKYRHKQREENPENERTSALERTEDDDIEVIQDSYEQEPARLSTIPEGTEKSSGDEEGDVAEKSRTRRQQRKAADRRGLQQSNPGTTKQKNTEAPQREKGKPRLASKASVSPGLSVIAEEDAVTVMLTPGQAIYSDMIADGTWDPDIDMRYVLDLHKPRDSVVRTRGSAETSMSRKNKDADEQDEEEQINEDLRETKLYKSGEREDDTSEESGPSGNSERNSGNKRRKRKKPSSNRRPKAGQENDNPNKRRSVQGNETDETEDVGDSDDETVSYAEETGALAQMMKRHRVEAASLEIEDLEEIQDSGEKGNEEKEEEKEEDGDDEERVEGRGAEEKEAVRYSRAREVPERSSNSLQVYPRKKKDTPAGLCSVREAHSRTEPADNSNDVHQGFSKGKQAAVTREADHETRQQSRRCAEDDICHTRDDLDESGYERLGTTAFTPPYTHQRKTTHAGSLDVRFGKLRSSSSKREGASKRSVALLDDSGLGTTPASEKPKRRRSVVALEDATTPPKRRRVRGTLAITITKTPSGSDVSPSDPEESDEEEEIDERGHQFVDWSKSGPSNAEPNQRGRRAKKTGRGQRETRTKPRRSLTPEEDKQDDEDDEDESGGLLLRPKKLFSSETPVSRRVKEEANDDDLADAEIMREVHGVMNSLQTQVIPFARRKRQFIKEFAIGTTETTLSTIESFLTHQQTTRTKTTEAYNCSFQRQIETLETDMEKTCKAHENFLAMLQERAKALANERSLTEKRLQNLQKMQSSYEEKMTFMERTERECQASIKEKVREELNKKQQEFLTAMEKDSRDNLRKAMQAMLAQSMYG